MTQSSPAHVTQLLRRWKLGGDREAEQELFVVVEQELTRIAQSTLRSMSGFAHKIEPCELVSQAYLNLLGFPIITENRAPFFKLMSTTMRHVLIDLARHDHAIKRPPSRLRIVDTHAADSVPAAADIDLIDFYSALDALRAISGRQADTIELRIMGLSNQEIAVENNVSLATVKRDVDQGRAFLAFQLGLPANWLKP